MQRRFKSSAEALRSMVAIAAWGFAICLSARVSVAKEESPEKMGGAAMAEMSALQTSLDIFEIDYGYYVSLETLDDIDITPTTPQYDYVFNSPGLRVMRPYKGIFETSPFLGLPSPPYNGPYATYQPGRTQVGPTPYDEGSPLDPWNRPYLLYSPLGLVRGDTGSITLEYHGDQFDRWAIVSLGPDGQVSSDDVIRLFGSGLSSAAISSITGPAVTLVPFSTGSLFIAPAGATITINGYNLGASQGTSQVYYGATPLAGAVAFWSNTTITMNLSAGVSGFGNITVHVGPIGSPAVTNPLALQLEANSSRDWTAFE